MGFVVSYACMTLKETSEMRINARLDDERSRKLEYIKSVTGTGTSDIIKQAIDDAYDRVRASSVDAAKTLMRVGFVGCGDGPPDLSENYKRDLETGFANKHGHS